jgi:eukaryotic-like serine/threonine-protein kinase
LRGLARRRAQNLVQKLSQDFPLDTMMQDYTLPTIRAAIELKKHNPSKAIDLLRVVSPYELGSTSALRALYPVYVRGEAFSAVGRRFEAVAEFRKLVDHPGVVDNSVLGPLAHLQMARAYVLASDKKASLVEYQLFLNLWKEADPDIPVLRTAKTEYSKLQ